MPDSTSNNRDMASLPRIVGTIHPPSPPLENVLDRYWESGPQLDSVEINIRPPHNPLALLEQLGPSPFERGGFPLIGFLATTYEKVSRFALLRD